MTILELFTYIPAKGAEQRQRLTAYFRTKSNKMTYNLLEIGVPRPNIYSFLGKEHFSVN
jgi:hypothetical protein